MKAPALPREFLLYSEAAASLMVVNRLIVERRDTMFTTLKPITDRDLNHGDKLRRIAGKLMVRTARRQQTWEQVVAHG